MWRGFFGPLKPAKSARETVLDDLIKMENLEFGYLYDLGDKWGHSIVVEKIVDKKDQQCPVLLDGERACPPEDCGGVYGYHEILEIQRDPSHPLYQERIVDWLGEEFDPDYFDVDDINKRLRTDDFEDLVDAFEDSSGIHVYHIDTVAEKILYYNDAVMEPWDKEVRDAIDSCEDDNWYLYIPPRSGEEEHHLMEMFAYALDDYTLTEKFLTELEKEKPFRRFKTLLSTYPDLRKKWFDYKHNAIKNETINWLCENNIELKNQQLIPKIEIRELSERELKKLPKELKGFSPFACLNCRNEEGLKARWFTINVSSENRLIEKETQRVMKEKFGINHHGGFGGGEQDFLTAAKCPKCGSENIFWDF